MFFLRHFIASLSLDVVHLTPMKRTLLSADFSDILGLLNLVLWYPVFSCPELSMRRGHETLKSVQKIQKEWLIGCSMCRDQTEGNLQKFVCALIYRSIDGPSSNRRAVNGIRRSQVWFTILSKLGNNLQSSGWESLVPQNPWPDLTRPTIY